MTFQACFSYALVCQMYPEIRAMGLTFEQFENCLSNYPEDRELSQRVRRILNISGLPASDGHVIVQVSGGDQRQVEAVTATLVNALKPLQRTGTETTLRVKMQHGFLHPTTTIPGDALPRTIWVVNPPE